MRVSFRSVFMTIILTTLVFSTSPIGMLDDNRADKQEEKNVEKSLIYQDAKLTTEMNFANYVNRLREYLTTHDNLQESELKNNFPEIVSITKSFKNPTAYGANHFTFFGQSNYRFFKKEDGLYSVIQIPVIRNNVSITYHIKMKSDLFTHIEQKQQLRMYTVTYLQNNRWKTTPTKYTPKKKLSLSMNENLPDLKPQLEEKGISHYIQNEVIIKFKDKINEKELKQLSSKYNISIKKKNHNTVVAHCKDKTTKKLIKLLEAEAEANPHIDYVEPHFIYLTNKVKKPAYPFIPNDRLYLDYQWNLPIIFTEQGWELTKGKKNIIIAVIDTGVDINHPEFKGKLVDGTNLINPSELPIDDDGHGTHVAGIISANTNNDEGIAGITWYNRIMPIKVLDQSGSGTLFDVAEGIIWATDHGAKVINLSLGNYAESKYLHDAVKYAYERDVVLIAATGNDNTNDLGYPAAYPEVIGVSAIDPYHRRAEFSNYGNYVDVVAPGVNIPSTYPDNQYAALSGTSMASPHVAGLAGLIRSINPSLSNKQVNRIIKETAIDLGEPGKDQFYGYGQINIEKAVLQSLPNQVSRSFILSWLFQILYQK